VRVKGLEVETPSGRNNFTEQVSVVPLEDGRFLSVRGGRGPVTTENRDGIAAQPAGGRGVEKLCVFVPLKGKLDFGAEPPVKGLFLSSKV
jgi:hypothetical protein